MTHERLHGYWSGIEEPISRKIVHCIRGYDRVHRNLVLSSGGICLVERYAYRVEYKETPSILL
jgi:hypothetical protein